jgi:hypothetical protein
MAIIETNQPGGNFSGAFRIARALAPVSRAFYRAGLWLVYGGAAAEMIFHGAVIESWRSGWVSVGSNAAARS